MTTIEVTPNLVQVLAADPPELPWGRRFRDMREHHRNVKVDDRKISQETIAAALSEILDWEVDDNIISRLERRATSPDQNGGKRERRLVQVVYLATIAYGYDPRQLGLSLSVLPMRLRELGFERLCHQVLSVLH